MIPNAGLGIGLSYGAGNGAFNAFERQTARMASATGSESVPELLAMHRADRADALQRVQDEINYKISEVENANYRGRKRKAEARAQRHLANGWIF